MQQEPLQCIGMQRTRLVDGAVASGDDNRQAALPHGVRDLAGHPADAAAGGNLDRVGAEVVRQQLVAATAAPAAAAGTAGVARASAAAAAAAARSRLCRGLWTRANVGSRNLQGR